MFSRANEVMSQLYQEDVGHTRMCRNEHTPTIVPAVTFLLLLSPAKSPATVWDSWEKVSSAVTITMIVAVSSSPRGGFVADFGD